MAIAILYVLTLLWGIFIYKQHNVSSVLNLRIKNCIQMFYIYDGALIVIWPMVLTCVYNCRLPVAFSGTAT